MLFTQRAFTAAEALQFGLVRSVVAREKLWEEAMELAHHISQHNPFGLAQAKRAVNQTLDVQGYYAALQSVFDIHHTGHGNAMSITGFPILMRLEGMKEGLKANEEREAARAKG
jgi:enoyl-CoA hydratase/carnithine racemase